MKRIITFSAVLLLFAAITSCHKDKQTLTDNTWIVESMKLHTDSALMYYMEGEGKIHRIPILYFEKNKYFFQNRIVDDIGKVKFRKNNGIEFESFPTILVGGGTEFGYDCHTLLIRSINHYTINNNKLVFTGNNGETINLIKKE